MNPEEEFDECLTVKGNLERNGYSKTWYGNKNWWTHRLVWTILNGQIPKGMCVCHRCDNRACINPQHFFLGSQSDNLRDAARKGRIQAPRLAKNCCKRGHPFSKENTRIQTNGARLCKTCHRQKTRECKMRIRANEHRTII